MPTIKQLPLAVSVAATDELPLSQGGQTKSIRAGVLLSGTQPAITLAPGKLVGRVSGMAGGPEPVGLGPGLAVQGAVLAATGADHASFAPAAGLSTGDEVVLNSGGSPRRMPATALRGLFSAGPGVSIQGGVISSSGGPAAVIGTTSGTVAAGDDPRINNSVQRDANLGDLPSVAAARSNLGLAPVAATGAYADLNGRPAIPTDNAQLGNGRGFVDAPNAAQIATEAAAGVITVSGPPNAGGALGTHMDIYNPGTTTPTEIVYGTRITYTNTQPGQTTYDFGHAVQAVWQQAPGVPGGQMFGLWTIAEGPTDSASSYGLVGYEINTVNRGDDTGWTYARGNLPRFSAALQLAPESNTFTHGGVARNVTAALVIGQSPTPGANGQYVRNHSGVLIEPNAITGTVGRAFTVTGDITSATPAPSTPWGVMTVLGAWLHGVDLTGATVFDNAALRLLSNQRVAWNNAAGTQTAFVGSNEGGDVVLSPAGAGVARAGANALWHAGNLDPSTLAPRASPAFTGTPTVPTAAPGTGTTQAASTAFVGAAVGVAAGALSGSAYLNNALTSGTAGALPRLDIYTAAYTWTRDARAALVDLVLIGAGGGGGAGAVTASGTASSGGAGGGAGARVAMTVPAALVGASVSGTIGAGGASGAASGVTGTGAAGGAGGNSSFGALLAYGGGGGGGGVAAANSTGGVGGGANGTGSGATMGGSPGSPSTALGGGGGGGGGFSAAPGLAGQTGNLGGPASGAAGGGVTAAAVFQNGASGGAVAGTTAAAATTTNGGSGAAASPPVFAYGVGASGGGGAGGSAGTGGGAGGAGSGYGTGGSGGGSAVAGSLSGAGAAGRPGLVIVVQR